MTDADRKAIDRAAWVLEHLGYAAFCRLIAISKKEADKKAGRI